MLTHLLQFYAAFVKYTVVNVRPRCDRNFNPVAPEVAACAQYPVRMSLHITVIIFPNCTKKMQRNLVPLHDL